MNPCDKREREISDGHFAIVVSVLLLAFAVFGWGLHSKLSLYHVRARASETTPIAKLLSERERPTDMAQHCDLNHSDLHVAALAASVVLIPQPADQVLDIPRRGDTPPQPPSTLALKGPTLRRPPPSVVA